jgi:pimeloyl-ACP methyl ester carboxylesterase
VRDIDGAELVVLPNLAHSPQLEDPATVLAHALPFLAARRP